MHHLPAARQETSSALRSRWYWVSAIRKTQEGLRRGAKWTLLGMGIVSSKPKVTERIAGEPPPDPVAMMQITLP